MEIRRLFAPDFKKGFFETLEALTDVGIDDEREAAKIFQEMLKKGIEIFVATVGERVIGTITLFIEPKFIHKGGKVAHIEDVAVHKTFQGQGIGLALVEHVKKRARDAGCYKVILDCSGENVPFYERAGFRQHEIEMRCDLDGPQPRLDSRGVTAEAVNSKPCKTSKKRKTTKTKTQTGKHEKQTRNKNQDNQTDQ